MDLYCIKHKKQLVEKLNNKNEIVSYCVYCDYEKEYITLSDKYDKEENILNIQNKKSRKLLGKVSATILLIFLLNLVLHWFLSIVIGLFVLNLILFRNVTKLKAKPSKELIQAKKLNESSIFANNVEQKKRQWKKDYLQENKGEKLNVEKWNKHLRQFYKRD
ncbi:hypothetical protein [Bacillus alkalisoli]|uniref:hypothetical protein n=1 Tax=Bacillus alkalisoli TaxID=2011008 RepID=UPI000C233B8A|nr:hypothetical protein [Bacillus alkalisoli]